MSRFAIPFAALLIVCVAGPSNAQPAGGWHIANSMSVGRTSVPMVAVRLKDGGVLVVGGSNNDNRDVEGSSQASADVFDPVTETWTSVAPMSTRRSHAVGVTLDDGRVLVAGGFNRAGEVMLASAEIYDPALDIWSAAASMSMAHAFATATLLQDGRVLVAGGQHEINFATTASEIYDPLADRWTTVAPLAVPHALHTATRLLDGRVLVVGGWTVQAGQITATAQAEVFDPVTGTWTSAGALPNERFQLAATLLHDGRVVVAGGARPGNLGNSRQAHLYHPGTNTWADAADLSIGRAAVSAVTLPDGRVLVTGGSDAFGALVRTAELYDPLTNAWASAGTMSALRANYGMVLLPDGRILVAGGCCERESSLSHASAEIFTLGCTSEATGAVQLFASGFTSFLLAALQFQWVLVRNPTTAEIPGPIAYATDALENAVAVTANTTTCLGTRPRPFFRIETGADNVLSPGEYGLALIWFYQTGPGPITYTPRVLGGMPGR
jgi:N-acetylneuraminic acid mutarotase